MLCQEQLAVLAALLSLVVLAATSANYYYQVIRALMLVTHQQKCSNSQLALAVHVFYADCSAGAAQMLPWQRLEDCFADPAIYSSAEIAERIFQIRLLRVWALVKVLAMVAVADFVAG